MSELCIQTVKFYLHANYQGFLHSKYCMQTTLNSKNATAFACKVLNANKLCNCYSITHIFTVRIVTYTNGLYHV